METASQVVLSPEWTSAPTALQSRMQQLQGRVEGCRQRLQAQDQSVADICRGALELQAQAEALKRRLEDMGRRLQELGVGVVSIPTADAAPAADPPQPPGREPGPGLLKCLPYLLIAAAGIGYGLTSQALPTLAAAPAASVPPASGISASAAAADPESEALRLVYEYRLPGTEQDMLDLIGSQEEALGPSPWEIACDEDLRCDVSFTSRSVAEEEPLYGFAVDLGAKTVTPSPETAERLLSSAVAQNGAG
jgi:hypothetical protein